MAQPSTTIVPFTNTQVLPTCATACGALYDANGGCVPPAVDATLGTTAFTSCFCANTAVTAFSSQVTGVCDDACVTDGLSSIANWFRSICSVDSNDSNNADSNKDTASSATATAKASSGGSNDWLSNHWKWVIMLVILVVGITGIWIGACIWRRRYIRKRDRQNSLGQKQSGSVRHPSWGPGVGSGSEAPDPAPAGYDSQRNSHAVLTAGAPASSSASQEKPAKKNKKKWTVSERT